MKNVYTFFLVIFSLSADNRLIPIPTTKHDHGLPAKSDEGAASILAREMLVDVTYSDGRPRKGAILVLFDAVGGRYIWEFGPVGMNETTSTMTRSYGSSGIVHRTSDRLVLFAFGHPNLIIHESFTKASGIDDAEMKALAEATGRLPAKLAHKTDDRILINLGKQLPREFFLACMMCSGPAAIKLLDTAHQGNTWEIILQGQWQQKITLNEKYELTGTVRIK